MQKTGVMPLLSQNVCTYTGVFTVATKLEALLEFFSRYHVEIKLILM